MYQKLDTFFVALYTIVDDLYQEQFSEVMKKKPGVRPKFTDSEHTHHLRRRPTMGLSSLLWRH